MGCYVHSDRGAKVMLAALSLSPYRSWMKHRAEYLRLYEGLSNDLMCLSRMTLVTLHV